MCVWVLHGVLADRALHGPVHHTCAAGIATQLTKLIDFPDVADFGTGAEIFFAMPTTVSSGIVLTGQAGGNEALALLLTVSTRTRTRARAHAPVRRCFRQASVAHPRHAAVPVHAGEPHVTGDKGGVL